MLDQSSVRLVAGDFRRVGGARAAERAPRERARRAGPAGCRGARQLPGGDGPALLAVDRSGAPLPGALVERRRLCWRGGGGSAPRSRCMHRRRRRVRGGLTRCRRCVPARCSALRWPLWADLALPAHDGLCAGAPAPPAGAWRHPGAAARTSPGTPGRRSRRTSGGAVGSWRPRRSSYPANQLGLVAWTRTGTRARSPRRPALGRDVPFLRMFLLPPRASEACVARWCERAAGGRAGGW